MADDDPAPQPGERHFIYVSEADRYPKPVVRPRGAWKLSGVEKTCVGFAWFVCVWLIVAGGVRIGLMLTNGVALDFMPFTGMVLGLIGLLLMTCLHDEWKMRK